MSQLPSGTVIIEGECEGADILCRDVAKELGLEYIPFHADWTKYGRAAGPIRNSRQLKEGKPTECLAFHNNIRKSQGTADMVAKCRKAGVPVRIITE